MEATMCSQVTKWGNSLAVRIPKAMADQLSLSEDSPVDIEVTGGRIVISPHRREYTLEELVAQITPENRVEEISFGPPVGAELI